MGSLKILFIIDNLGSGGAQNQSTLLAMRMADMGHEINFFTYYKSGFFLPRLQQANIKHFFVPKTSRTGWNVIKAISQLLKEESYDLAISFLDTPNFYLTIARKISGTKTKVIISERALTKESFWSFRFQTKKIAHKLADFATTNSHHERERLIKRAVTRKGKIVTIYNGVDTNHYKPVAKEYRIHNRFICVASISPYKNGMLLIEAMRLLKEAGKLNFEVDWYGAKVHSIQPRHLYILAMENAIKTHGLEKYWHWQIPVKNLNEKYRTYDALIHTSYQEGLPNVVCEALASGLPIIVSNVLDHPILADQEKNGLLFDYQNPEELKEKILKFQQSGEATRMNYTSNARAFAQKKLSYDVFVKNYNDLFLQLTAQ